MTVATRIHAKSVSFASSPASSTSRPGGSFPYIYVLVAICAAAGLGLVARRLLVRRAVHRA